MENVLYAGPVYWVYDHEIASMCFAERYLIRHLSFSPPLSRHKGNIQVTAHSISMQEYDNEFNIELSDITQLYLGFDDSYSRASAKNFGVFWRPLRIELENETLVYLIVDYKNGFSKNGIIFELLKKWC